MAKKENARKRQCYENQSLYTRYIKRLLDILFSLAGLVILLPIILITAFFVRIKLGTPVLFVQERPGKNEKLFKLYKFRTMTDQKDEHGNLLPDKIRLTGLGKLLRDSSLDELPEIINILKGDMSIVGPRPLLVKYLPLYNEEQRHRHDVRPGLTGYAQVHGRNNTTWEERFKQDIEYVKNITFSGDMKIILDTLVSVLKHENIDSSETQKFTMTEFTGTRGTD